MAESKVIDLEVKTNLGSLKAQLREAQAEVAKMAEKFGDTSVEAANAAKAAAILKDKIGDAKALTDAFNPDAKFSALSNSIGGVLNGFQAYEGAMGLIGVESEQLQATLLKVQSAMALSQGIQGALEAKDSFMQLGSVVKNAFTGMTNASKIFLATGIGAIVAGLALLISNWDSVTEALGAATAAQRINSKAKLDATAAISKEVSAANSLSNSLKDETLNRAEKLRLIKAFQADYPGLLSNINLEKDSITSINKQLGDNIKLLQLQAEAKALASVKEETYTKKTQLQLQLQTGALENASNWTIRTGEDAQNGMIGFTTAAENAALSTKKLTDFQNSSTESLDKQIKSIDESEKAINKKIDALKKAGAATGDLSQAEKNAIAAAEAAKQKADAAAEAAKQKAEADAAARAAKVKADLEQLSKFQSDAAKANADARKTEQQIELDNVDLKYKEQIALAIKYKKDYTAIIEAQENEKYLIKRKYSQKQDEDFAAETAALKKLEDEKNAIELAGIEARSAAQREQSAKEKELRDKIRADEAAADKLELENKQKGNTQKMQMAVQAFSVLQDATTLFTAKNDKDARKQFQINKALSLSSAIVNTALAVTGALTAGGNPIKLATGMQFVEAGIAAAAGGVSIAKIAGSQYGGFSAGGSGGGGGGGDKNIPTPTAPQSAPNFNLVGATGLNQLDMLGKPIQAFVVGGEVTTYQELERNRLRNATL
jgi:colicin import membrane protein